MTDQGLLPIGMFSRASLISIKTLRAYHEAGILVPAEVDRDSGYRMYTPDQLADAAIVRRLRALDLPLDRVRDVIQARDPDLTRRILADHEIRMQARLEETARIVAELQSGVAPVTHTPVHVRYEEPVDTVSVSGSVTEAQMPNFILGSLEHLLEFVSLIEITPLGAPGTLYTADIPDEVEHVEAVLRVPHPVGIPSTERDIRVGEVPGAWVAVLVHPGDYATMADTYRTLGAWVARNAEPSGERIREWYAVSPLDTDTPSEWRTEIGWPIKPPVDSTSGGGPG
jgi:DNA-binding transcriptional MerR regulator